MEQSETDLYARLITFSTTVGFVKVRWICEKGPTEADISGLSKLESMGLISVYEENYEENYDNKTNVKIKLAKVPFPENLRGHHTIILNDIVTIARNKKLEQNSKLHV